MMTMDYRHTAYNVVSGQIINSEKGNSLKRAVAYTRKVDKELYGTSGQWRFSHDYGKNWLTNGLPER